MQPAEIAKNYGVVPDKCPTCGGTLKDYNAETVITQNGHNITYSPGLLVHLYICQWCSQKLFAPPRIPAKTNQAPCR
jgi:hypothetical protein